MKDKRKQILKKEPDDSRILTGRETDMKKNLLLGMLIVTGVWTRAQCQPDRGNKLTTVVRASTVPGGAVGCLKYSYTVINAPSSPQTLETYRLAVDGISKEQGTYANFIAPQSKKWYFDINEDHGLLSGTAASRILDLPPENGLAPGESMTFSFESKGLPAIQPFWATGWTKPLSEDERDSLRALGFSDDEISPSDWRDNAYRGFTVAPQLPPERFDSLAFLDTLISYKHQAFALGWIKEEGIVTSLDAKLEAARPQIIADRPSAKNILQSFVNELEALNTQGNQITGEAYALLKFNAQYLISKL
jgi:hypothetical protein